MAKGDGGNNSKQGLSFNMGVPSFSDTDKLADTGSAALAFAVAIVTGAFLKPVIKRGIMAAVSASSKLVGAPAPSADSTGGDSGSDDKAIQAHRRIGAMQNEFNALKNEVSALKNASKQQPEG